ncbi:carbon starvation CstA family protein, partial [Vibrio parahaemolyticus V-223/04]
AHSDG